MFQPVDFGIFGDYNYQDYLASDLWNSRKAEAIRLAKYKCQDCGNIGTLQVHHLRYTNLGHEPDEDLTVLCKNCHKKRHGINTNNPCLKAK